ncbi:hypothetical protein ACFLSY_00825 [Bacteroidota bacterium]
MKKNIIYIIAFLVLQTAVIKAQSPIPFTNENWELTGKAENFQGEEAFMGRAVLKDVEFLNGTIEYDLNITGARSFPGINFRMQQNGDSEHFYIRPHKVTGYFYDALQYSPVYHGVSCWQLYHGEGATGAIVMETNKWLHIKIVIKDSQAKLYLNENPVFEMTHLEHNPVKGSIALNCPADGSAHFANFKYSEEVMAEFEETISEPEMPGVISEWKISSPIINNLMDYYSLPNQEEFNKLEWKNVISDKNGLVNLSRELTRNPVQPGWIYAKTNIKSKKAELHRFGLGYSDYITVFINGQAVFMGNNAFQSQNTSYAGLIGYFDEVFLPLNKGDNELVLIVGENFGGWGFMFRDAEAIFIDPMLTKLWENKFKLDYPESVEYDPARNVLYATNNFSGRGEYISKISMNGEILEKEWIKGLNRPTGSKIAADKFYTVERTTLTEIDIEKGEITKRIELPGAIFPNDVTASSDGKTIYVSDNAAQLIWKIEEGVAEVWMKGGELKNPNGLFLSGDRLIVGCTADASLKEIDVNTKEVTVLAHLKSGAIMDGIQVLKDGRILFTDYNGHLYLLEEKGNFREILNTSTSGITLADFKYIPEKEMLVIPTLYLNKVICYKIKL